MYKMDRTFVKAKTIAEAEQDKKFPVGMPIGERLREAWWLTCMAYQIDPANPPRMDKQYFSVRKHSR